MPRSRSSKFGKEAVDVASQLAESANYVYNVGKGLARWRTSMAKMKAGVVPFLNVSVLGDSISDGVGISPVTDFMTKGYLGRIRGSLSSKYGDAGTGLVTSYFPYFDTPKSWTYTGTWTTPTDFGFAGGLKQSTANGDTAQLSFNGTGICVVFWGDSWGGAGGRTCNIQIDGGVPISFDSYSNESKVISTTITGLSDGNHTLLITSTSGNKVFLCGAYPIKGTSGIRVHCTGRSGATAGTFVGENIISSCIDFFNPELTIISLGANDYIGNIDPAIYKANMQTLITRAKQFGDVLLVSSGLCTDERNYDQSQYVDAIRELAISNNVSFVDIFNRWSGDANYAKNTLELLNDDVHPTAIGHQDMATAILKVIDEY